MEDDPQNLPIPLRYEHAAVVDQCGNVLYRLNDVLQITPSDIYTAVFTRAQPHSDVVTADPPPSEPSPKPADDWTPTTDMVLHPEKYSAEDLAKLVHAMHDDWRTINEIYNERARMYHWCELYESNQARYNERLRVLELMGRPGMLGKSEFSWTGSDPVLYRETVL